MPAVPKITTRIRPIPVPPPSPVAETLTTHAADCPECGRETRVGLGTAATVYGSCPHLKAVHQSGDAVSIQFEGSQ